MSQLKPLGNKLAPTLIDADMVIGQAVFGAEARYKIELRERGEERGFEEAPFSYVQQIIDRIIYEILLETKTDRYALVLSSSSNFRYGIFEAYKADRPTKPANWRNAYVLLESYGGSSYSGLEADDCIGVICYAAKCVRSSEGSDYSRVPTVASRDKDLHICPAIHYSWEVWRSPSFGPELLDNGSGSSIGLGDIKLKQRGRGKQLWGFGLKFFYCQLLMGDSVDNIPGVRGCGPVKAFKLIDVCTTEMECFEVVMAEYERLEIRRDIVRRNGRLLWMTHALHEDGTPVLWEMPDEREEEMFWRVDRGPIPELHYLDAKTWINQMGSTSEGEG